MGLNANLLQTEHDLLSIELLLVHGAAGRLQQGKELVAGLSGVVLDDCSNHIQIQEGLVEIGDVLLIVVLNLVQDLKPIQDRPFLKRKQITPF